MIYLNYVNDFLNKKDIKKRKISPLEICKIKR